MNQTSNPLAIGLAGGPPAVIAPVPPMRMAAIQTLELMRQTTAPATVVAEVDMSNLEQLYRLTKPSFEQQTGTPLTYMAFFARATVKALQAHPSLNGILAPGMQVIPRQIHLAIATQAPGVILLPTIHNAERLSIPTLAREIHQVGLRGRAGLISPLDMDSTFVITNTGKYGKSLFGTPTIKPPNTGILAFEAITRRPVVVADDRIEVRPMMYIALTADQRAVGRDEMDGFLNTLKEVLERLAF